jgi:hypothetical protein
MIKIDIPSSDPAPKRGDLVQTNVGDKRERTWFVIQSHAVKGKIEGKNRYHLFIVRWWELDPEVRRLLYESAERRGGQRVIQFTRYSPQWKKRTFEQYMGGL